MVEFAFRSFVQDPFHLEAVDVGIDLGETRMINFKSADFAADLPKSRASVPYMESVDIAEKKSCVGGVTRLNRVASWKRRGYRKIGIGRIIKQLCWLIKIPKNRINRSGVRNGTYG